MANGTNGTRKGWVLLCWLVLFAFLFLGLLLLPAIADALPGDPLLSQQTSLSLQVRSALEGSRLQMIMLEELSNGLSQKLGELESLRERDREELTLLSARLEDMTNSLWESSLALEDLNLSLLLERERNRRMAKWLAAGAILFLINVLGKVLIAVLRAKGVKVPYWVALLV